MPTFRCKTRCFFGETPGSERIFEKGELFTGAKANAHFTELNAEVDSEVIEQSGIMKAIKKALQAFDHDDDKLWTNQGLPAVRAVEEAIGDETIGRKEITDAFPGFERDVSPLGKQKTITGTDVNIKDSNL